MPKRKPLSKSVRFEVFKRDSFKCQYCGRSAPNVILEVDHIVPVAEGGGDDMINLITSCRDCNRGKSKKLLTDTSAIDRQKRQLDDLNEMREQTEMMIEWKRELLQLEETQINAIDDYIHSLIKGRMGEYAREGMRRYIKRFGFAEVFEATEIAFARYDEPEYALEKIGGICYNRAKQREELAYAKQDH